jgi:hypothetical protein
MLVHFLAYNAYRAKKAYFRAPSITGEHLFVVTEHARVGAIGKDIVYAVKAYQAIPVYKSTFHLTKKQVSTHAMDRFTDAFFLTHRFDRSKKMPIVWPSSKTSLMQERSTTPRLWT